MREHSIMDETLYALSGAIKEVVRKWNISGTLRKKNVRRWKPLPSNG
jgi:hypothetical protein